MLVRVILLSFFLLLISTSALAHEHNQEKPEDWEVRLEMLRAVPYIDFSEDIVDEGDTGVVLYDPEKACDGYSLYCTRFSGEALLLDMYGRVVHRWTCLSIGGKGNYMYGIVLENGDLVIIKRYRTLLRLSWDSELIWQKKLVVDHDVALAPDGSFYTLVREKKAHRGLSISFDAIVHLTEAGEEIDRWSAYDHLAEIKRVLDTSSFLDSILDSMLGDQAGEDVNLEQARKVLPNDLLELDYFHMNTMNVLPNTLLGEKDSRFQGGNLLVCFRNVNQIAVLEKNTYRVLWAWGEGNLQFPHHPTMLESGHILIFDNGVERKYSRVVELDPVTEAIVWEHMAEPPEDFYSRTRGSAQRFPNGNTLICESNEGRAFEVTEEGEVVWVWLNPITGWRRRAWRRETVYRMLRLPSASVEKILNRWWWWK